MGRVLKRDGDAVRYTVILSRGPATRSVAVDVERAGSGYRGRAVGVAAEGVHDTPMLAARLAACRASVGGEVVQTVDVTG